MYEVYNHSISKCDIYVKIEKFKLFNQENRYKCYWAINLITLNVQTSGKRFPDSENNLNINTL